MLSHRRGYRFARSGNGRRLGLYCCQPLEGRLLLSTIHWENRDSSSNNLEVVFGPINAPYAKAVIDCAILSWERVIERFRRPEETDIAYELSIYMDVTRQNYGAVTTLDLDCAWGQPDDATIAIGVGEDQHGNDWYLDPDPSDSAEFTNFINGYAAYANPTSWLASKADLYSVVAHEIGHAVGMTSDWRADWSRTSHLTDTDVQDQVDTAGTWYLFDSPAISHLMTSANGDGWADPAAHTAFIGNGAGQLTYNGVLYTAAEDLMNRSYFRGHRNLIPFTVTEMLADVYHGYTINDPSRWGSFYSVLDNYDGRLRVRGGPGTSADEISIWEDGGAQIHVRSLIGTDVPGTGSGPSAALNTVYESVYPAASIHSIVIDAGEGNDRIRISATPGIPLAPGSLTINGGAGDDAIDVYNNAPALVQVDGGAGSNILNIVGTELTDTITVGADTANCNANAYSFSNVQTLEVDAGGGNDLITVRGKQPGTTVNVESGDGAADRIAIGGQSDSYLMSGTINVNASTWGYPALTIDVAEPGGSSFWISSNETDRLPGAAPALWITHRAIASLTINGGSGDDAIGCDSNITGAYPTTINGGNGRDELVLCANWHSLDNILSPFTFNGGLGDDVVILDDTGSAASFLNTWQITASSVTRSSPWPGLSYDSVAYLDIRGGTGGWRYNVNGLSWTTQLTIYGGDGDDAINVADVAHNVTAFGHITAHGGGGNDTVTLNDTANGYDDEWNITSTTAARYDFAGLSYDAETTQLYLGDGNNLVHIAGTPPASLTIDGGGGHDVFSLEASNSSGMLSLAGGSGDDSYQIASASHNLSDTAGSISVSGAGGGNDGLYVHDEAYDLGVMYSLTLAALGREGRSIVFSSLSNIELNCGLGVNTVQILETPPLATAEINAGPADTTFNLEAMSASTVLILHGGNGNDRFNVTPTEKQIGRVPGDPLFKGQGGVDTVTVNNQDYSKPDTFTLTETELATDVSGTMTFLGMEAMVLFGGFNDSTFYVAGVVAGMPTTIQAGAGNDIVNFCHTGQVLNAIQSEVAVDGDVGDDQIRAYDAKNRNTGPQTFVLKEDHLTRQYEAEFWRLRYLAVEGLRLICGDPKDFFDVQRTIPTLSLDTAGGPGQDQMTVHAPLKTPIAFAGNDPSVAPGDSLCLVGDGTTVGVYRPSGVTGSGTYAMDGQTITFSGLEPVQLQGFDTLTIAMPAGNASIVIDSPAAGQNRIAGTTNGVAFEYAVISDVTHLVLDTSEKADPADVHSVQIGSPGLVAAGLVDLALRMGLGVDSLILNGGVCRLAEDAGQGGAQLDVTVSGGELVAAHTQHWKSLTLANGARASMLDGAAALLCVDQLNLAATALLDLGNSDLIARGATVALIEAWVASARNATPLWGGPGIGTSAATSVQGLAVADGGIMSDGTFHGEPVTAADVLVKFTRNGDANLDGTVSAADYFRIDRGILVGGSGYRQGDFDYSGATDIDDYNLIDWAFLAAARKESAASVPPDASMKSAAVFNEQSSSVPHIFASSRPIEPIAVIAEATQADASESWLVEDVCIVDSRNARPWSA